MNPLARQSVSQIQWDPAVQQLELQNEFSRAAHRKRVAACHHAEIDRQKQALPEPSDIQPRRRRRRRRRRLLHALVNLRQGHYLALSVVF